MRDLAERMMRLFTGCELGHGTYGREDRTPGKAKTEIKKTARTLREPVTVEIWESHLRGERPLGIVPIMVDGTCWWGVIDVDTYDLSHADIVRRVESLRLPLHVCRSKSGGAHLFLFLEAPVSAERMRGKLQEMAAAMGYGGSEIFPKQTELLADRGDLGNWLNMPYYDCDRGTRYAVTADGRGISIERFLDLAEATRLSPEELDQLHPAIASPDSELADGPPCLQHLASVRVSEGGRNNALFAFGVLAKKKHPDSWESVLEQWNQKWISPALSTQEVQLIVRSLRRKEYNYRCKDQPICAHCDAQTCRTRRFGVGPGGASPGIASISILETQPPLFFVCLTSGGTVECTSDDILSSRLFQHAVLEQLRILFPLYKQDVWLNRVQECLEQATVIEAPREAGVAGTFMELLETFCTDRHRAQERDEMLLGKPWLDEENGQVWFRLADLMAHMERHRFREYNRPRVISRIREIGGSTKFLNLRGKGVNCWFVPASQFEMQREAHSVPRATEVVV